MDYEEKRAINNNNNEYERNLKSLQYKQCKAVSHKKAKCTLCNLKLQLPNKINHLLMTLI